MVIPPVPIEAGLPLTRRQLLQWMGSVGGSSMMMGAMGVLDLRGPSIGPRPEPVGSAAGTRVVILGAGISGLVVAHELSKRGYDYQVLEARDRVGGLNWTVRRGESHTELGPGGETQSCTFDEGQYLNAGPWRIPHDHHGILGYAKELGVRLEPFNDANEVMFSEDPACGSLANRKLRLRELTSDLWGHTAELIAKALDQGSLDSGLSADDKGLLLQFLVDAGYLDKPERIYTPNPRLRGSADAYDFAALLRSPFRDQIRSLTAGTGGPVPVLQPTGGMMEIPAAFARYHGAKITLGAKVVSVHTRESDVAVVWEDTRSGTRRETTADFVVSCLPMSILKRLDVNLPEDVAAAVKAHNHASSSKIGLQMRRRFWEEDDGIYGGHLQFQGYQPTASGGTRTNPLPSFSYPSHEYGSKKGVLLGYYGSPALPGLDGRPLIESPIARRIEHVLTHASKVHPQMRDEAESAYAVMWSRVEYSEGAWANNPGDKKDLLSRAHGRIYFGSAAISGEPAWQEGAVESAWRTVESLHARVMATSTWS